MYSLYGMTGLGSNGMGAADSPQISPQILQMLLAGASGSPLGGAMPNAAPFQGLPQHQAPMGAMMPQMPAGTGQQPQQGQQQGGLAGSGVSPQQLIQMLTGGSQQGLSPLQNPNNGPSILGNLIRGYGVNGMPGQGVLNGLSAQAAGNVASGAAGL